MGSTPAIALSIVALVCGACGRIGFDLLGSDDTDAAVDSIDASSNAPFVAPAHVNSTVLASASATDSEFSMVDAVTDGAGNLYVTGAFTGTANFGGGDHVSNGSDDAFIASFAPNLDYRWSESYGSSSSESASGGLIFLGSSVWGTGLFEGSMQVDGAPLVSLGADDRFLVRFAADGQSEGGASFGSSADDDFGGAIGALPDGLALGGACAGAVDFGGGALSGTSRDACMATFDTNLIHRASVRWSGTGTDYLTGLASFSNGDIAVIGTFSQDLDAGGQILNSAGVNDSFVARVAPNLSVLWIVQLQGTDNIGTSSIQVSSSDSVLVSGYARGSLQVGDLDVSSVDYNGYLLQLTGAGVPSWLVSVGGTRSEADNVVLGPSDQIYLIGSFSGTLDINNVSIDSRGSKDIYLAGLEDDGSWAWIETFGSVGDDEGEGLAITPAGDVYISGSVEQDADFGAGLVSVPQPSTFLVHLK